MSDWAPSSPSSLRIARALLAREASRVAKEEGAEPAAALQSACTRVSRSLCDSMGAGGCSALLARALASIEAAHPIVTEVRTIREGEIQLDRVAASVEVHGIQAATAAVEALLAELAAILSRLIGEDMATTLMDHDAVSPSTEERSER